VGIIGNSFFKTFRHLLFAAVLFGTMPLFINILTPYMSDSTIIVGRFVISFLILLLYCLLRKKSLRLNCKKDTVWIAIAGFFMVAYAFIFIRALDSYGSSRTLVWTYTFVILTTSLYDEIRNLKEKSNRIVSHFVCTVISLIVLFTALVLSNPFDDFSLIGIIDSMSWTFLGAVSGVLFGIRIIFIKHVMDIKTDEIDVPVSIYSNREETVLLREQFFTFVFALIFMISMPHFTSNINYIELLGFSIENAYRWLPLVVLALLGGVSTAMPSILLYKGLGAVKNSSSTQTIATLEIVIGVMLMSIFTEEVMQTQQYISAFLIFIAIAIKTNFIWELRNWLKSTQYNDKNATN